MPLVSGVCRVASAPMLSHGGSRLNASKPEANPKTSCPNYKPQIFSLCVFWNGEIFFFLQKKNNRKMFEFAKNVLGKCLSFPVPLSYYYIQKSETEKSEEDITERKTKKLHIQKKSNRLSNDWSIPLPRRREVHEKFTRFFFFPQNRSALSYHRASKTQRSTRIAAEDGFQE